MKTIICKSGIRGWQAKLHSIYSNFQEFKSYSDCYGIAERLGYASPVMAWIKNPTIQGSVNPSDYRKI